MSNVYHFNGIKFIVGKNAEDNWKIIREADKDFYWFHLENRSSAHVIIEIDELIEEEIDFAKAICIKHTFKNTHPNKIPKNIDYIFTQVKNLKFGDKVGEIEIKKLK